MHELQHCEMGEAKGEANRASSLRFVAQQFLQAPKRPQNW